MSDDFYTSSIHNFDKICKLTTFNIVIHEKSQMSSLSVITLINVNAYKGLGCVSKLN